MAAATEYDPRYLAGILHFNRHEYFEAHEVWEDLWHECGPENRRFYQSLIQAAVALYHWSGGNWRGAKRLFHSGRNYMSVYPPRHLGLDRVRFWQEMEKALADVLPDSAPEASKRLDLTICPTIQIDPAFEICSTESAARTINQP